MPQTNAEREKWEKYTASLIFNKKQQQSVRDMSLLHQVTC